METKIRNSSDELLDSIFDITQNLYVQMSRDCGTVQAVTRLYSSFSPSWEEPLPTRTEQASGSGISVPMNCGRPQPSARVR